MPGRVHKPVIPYHDILYSWQLSHAWPVIGACVMVTPPKVVKLLAMWHGMQSALVWTGICAGGPGGGSFSVGGAMLAKDNPAPWHCEQLLVIPVWPCAPITYAE